MEELIAFLRKNYTKLEAAEAECHIGDITFPLHTMGMRQFVCLADNVHIKPASAESYGIDEGPHQNVICYRLSGLLAMQIKFMICGKVLRIPDIEESESLMEEINV
jgi:intracellular sulfur oxidation DsrE/DsrF family protein